MANALQLVATVVCFLITVNSETPNEQPIVALTDGSVRGTVNKTVDKNTTYYAFRGIPFAEPPVGNLRFEAPVPKKPWTGILDATKDGAECIQDRFPVHGSEDCLFINVYVPKMSNETSLKPVMVWIYGGAFVAGNSSYESFGPDYLLDKDVLVVSLNYRLGIFGFLSTGNLVAPGNSGLKDQLLALKWVQNNIKIFGGDPEKVTIFGESAGSASVSYHTQSQQSKGLFRAAIMESGTSLCSWALCRINNRTNTRLAQNLGINVKNSTSFLSKLKGLDPVRLQEKSWDASIIEYLKSDIRNTMIYGPVIEPDHKEAFFSASSYDLLFSGKYNRVPFLLGFNSLEAALWPVNEAPANLYFLRYDLNNFSGLVPLDLNVNKSQKQEASALLKNYYFKHDISVLFGGTNLTQFISDDIFLRALRKYILFTYKYVPTYFYRFAYKGQLTGMRNNVQPDDALSKGVGHTEELYYLWRIINSGIPTSKDISIREQMVSWWTNFAKYLNPTPAQNTTTSGTIWKKSDENFTYFNIDNISESKQFPEKRNMELWDKVDEYGNPPYTTY